MGRVLLIILGILLVAPFVLSADINVCSSGCNYTSIQNAIDNASNGDIIYITSGTYAEDQILIDKQLDIIGDGADTTTIDGSGAILTATGLVRITASGDVTFSGFTIINAGGTSNAGDGNDDKTNVGIYTQSSSSSATYTISENKIYGTNDAYDEEDYGFYSNSGKEHLIFTNNIITETGANSLLLEKHTGSVDIENNTFDVGAYGIDAIFAMTYGGVDIISSYKIDNNYFDLSTGTYDHGAAAISIASSFVGGGGDGRFTNVEISKNLIDNMDQNRRGVTLWNGDLTDGNGGEITATVSDNIFVGRHKDSSRGISILGKTTNVEVLNNTISDLWRGIWITHSITGGLHYPINTHVNYNSFENNNYSLIWEGPSVLDAEYNWWGNCNGPFGDDVTGAGTTDYEPWLGVCIENETEISCSFRDDNVAIGADLEGINIDKVIIWTNINGTEKNYTALKFGNNYRATIPYSDLVGGQNVSWRIYVKDNSDKWYSGDERNFYVIKSTFLGVLPFPANGENGWYTISPIFSLVGDDSGIQSYYQWDSQSPIIYTGTPFGLEDSPNNQNLTGGIVDLHWWTQFICGGNLTNEPKQSTTLDIDLTNPIITDLNPDEGETIYGNINKISAYIDEKYQSNSGVNLGNIVMTLDGTARLLNITEVDEINARVEYYPDGLTLGQHNVSIYVTDNAGRNSYKEWNFEIKEVGAFDLEVISPLNNIYSDSKRILFDLSASEEVSEIEYINYNDRHPRWQRLCRNCDDYSRNKNINEGENNITIKATGKLGNIEEENLSIFVDSKKPRISRTLPKRDSVTNGSDFYIRYTEDNLQNIAIFWEKENSSGTKNLNCTAGKNQECFGNVDLSEYDGQEIEYWFNISDAINNVANKKAKVLIDTNSPNLTINMPKDRNESNPYDRRVPFNVSVSEYVVLEYIDIWDERPNWKRLCINCEEYGLDKTKTKSFRKGIHEVTIRATDKAGNSDQEIIGFYVDY